METVSGCMPGGGEERRKETEQLTCRRHPRQGSRREDTCRLDWPWRKRGPQGGEKAGSSRTVDGGTRAGGMFAGGGEFGVRMRRMD